MPDAAHSMNVIMQDATGSVPVRTYSSMCIIGEDGHKIETFTPRGVANATPVSNITIDGISQFEGLTNGDKTLTISGTGTSASWDGGTPVAISTNSSYTLYDSDDNNMILITVGSSAPADGDYTVTIQDGVLADAITVLQLEDELVTSNPVITDAAGDTCTAAGNYPRPTSAKNYAIYANDKSLIAIKNQVSPSPVVDISVDYSIYKIPRAYSSLTAVDADHKSGTEISKTAAKMFANGASTVSVINTWDGSTKQYALCLTELETQNYDYDIMVPTVDVDDAHFVLCATHAMTYDKIIIAPKIGTVSTVRASMGTFTNDEGQYAIAYDTDTYSVGELAGAAAAVIAQKKPWIPPDWASVSGINPAGYSKDDIVSLEGTGSTLRVNTFIQVGTYTVLSSARALKAGTWIDVPRTKQYLKDAVIDAWVSAKLQISNSGGKIPYTAAGLQQVKNIITTPLMRAQTAGALRETTYTESGESPGFIVDMPNIDDIPAAYKAARQLPDVTITAYLSGAVETIDPVYFTVSLGEV